MTAQTSERLLYNGESLDMLTEPLAPFLDSLPSPPAFQHFSTGCWRCYVGHWEIKNERLYLMSIDAQWKDDTLVSLNDLFPGCHVNIFAKWFTGTVRCGQGKMLGSMNMGFGSMYERHLLLDFVDGVLIHTQIKHNNDPKNQTWFW